MSFFKWCDQLGEKPSVKFFGVERVSGGEQKRQPGRGGMRKYVQMCSMWTVVIIFHAGQVNLVDS